MNIQDTRDRIESISNKKLNIIVKFQLQTACRLSEAVGKYAVKPNDLKITQYKGHDVALWTLRTAKRNGIERIVALPFSEVWVNELVEYFQNRKKRVFQYGMSSVNHLLAKELRGFKYRIEKYWITKNVFVEEHERKSNSHALRHLRLSELVNVYGFNDIDLATFAGWRMKGMAKRYVTSAWGRYIDKLLRV